MRKTQLLIPILLFAAITVQSQNHGSLWLVDADSDQNVLELQDGGTYNLEQLGIANISIDAVPNNPAIINRAVFVYGPLSNPTEVTKGESVAPYAIFGDSNGNYLPWPYVETHLDVELSMLIRYRRASDNVFLEDTYRFTFTRTGTPPQDTTAPSINQFTASAQGADAIALSWNVSDDTGIASRSITYSGGGVPITSNSGSTTVMGLNASTTYTFTLSVADAAGNSANDTATATTEDSSTTPTGPKLDLTGLSVSQSSTGFGGTANKAIDGDVNSFTHTDRNDPQPWWRIDLGESYDINALTVYNRANCCQERLEGFQVYIGNIDSSDPSDFTNTQINLSANLVQNFNDLNIEGRYLMVYSASPEFLSLGEIEIYGSIPANNGGGSTGPGIWTELNSVATYSGKVAVGTANVPSDYQMAIDGKLITEEVRVELSTTWPDYVFKDEYQLPTLIEVQKHIKEKGHLPNIPSAKEVEENGVQLGEMNKLLLEKIEELTLYTLQQQKELAKQKQVNQNLMQRLEKLEEKLNH